MAVAAFGLAAFVGCLVLVLLSFALAYGLITLGIWDWAAFLIVSGTYVLLAGVVVGIALLRVRRLSGLSKTRKTVTEGLGMLRNEVQHPDGQRPEITAPKTR
jgi:Putative Actinobacterial Holin-X, holin superfamily III